MGSPADSPRLAPKEWVNTLARARTDVAAGRTHGLDDVLRDLDGDMHDLDFKQEASNRCGRTWVN